jgi:hypothetical protein
VTDVRLTEFAQLLATADEDARDALISRVKLMAMQAAAPEAFEPPITPLGEYLERDIPVPPILVEPCLLVRGGIMCTVGRAGKGKTQVNLNRILKWAAGMPLFPDVKTPNGVPVLAPTQPLKTLIIENEGAAGMFHKQIKTMMYADGYLTPPQRELVKENVLIWGDGGYSGLKLDDPNALNSVRAGCEKWEPDVVFIEPFRGLWSGDENSSTDMATVADALSGIAADFNCGVILTHHEKKGGAGNDDDKMSAARGSTVLEGVVATMENFEIAKGGDYREVSYSKIRYSGGEKILPIRMEWQHKDWWYRHVPLDAIEQAVLDVLAENEDPMTIGELVAETDEKEHKIRNIMKALVDQGKVKAMPSIQLGGNGTTGKRYRLAVPTGDDTGAGAGMSF